MRTRATTSSQRRRPQLPGILATTLDTWRPWKLGTSGAGTESGCETKLELPQRESLGLMNGPWGHLGASKVFGMEKGRWRGWNLACTVCRKLPLDRKVIFLPLFRQHWPQSDLRRGTMFPSSVWPPAVCGGLFKGMVINVQAGLSSNPLTQILFWAHGGRPVFRPQLEEPQLFPLGNRRMRKGRRTIQPHSPNSWYLRA